MAREKDWRRHRQWISRTALLAAFAASVLAGTQSPCPTCAVDDITLGAHDGSLLHARIFAPEHGETADLPAVVVSHGYLGNSGFLEVPWAADLTRLDIVALFLDRQGHGRSLGDWWPSTDNPASLADLYPDIRAAVAYLRAQRPRIDPGRIALLGHSDGGTGVVTVASADWDIAATVSLSASVAPWEYANHVVPKNLLLLYGADDRFILAETDALLMKSATRGYSSGEGEVGRIEDGSARRLLRVAGRGHLDLVHSDEARQAALEWLRDTFGLQGEVALSPLRTMHVIAGTILLFLLVLFWNGLPGATIRPERFVGSAWKLLVIGLLWIGAIVLAAWMGPRLRDVVPAQEGSTVVGLLVAPALVMGVFGALLVVGGRKARETHNGRARRRSSGASFRKIPLNPPFSKGEAGGGPLSKGEVGGGPFPKGEFEGGRFSKGEVGDGSRRRLSDIAWGACSGLIVALALETAFRPVYTTTVAPQRLALSLMFVGLAAPAFAATCRAASWVGGGSGLLARGVSVEAVLAALTALLTPWLFVRMSMLPAFVFALVLLFAAAYRAGTRSTAGAAAFGAVMYARVASVVCAFY